MCRRSPRKNSRSAAADALGRGQPGRDRGIRDVARLHEAVTPGLWCEDDDRAAFFDEPDGIHHRVGKVTVLVTEPQHHSIGYIVVVIVHKVAADDFLNGIAEVPVYIVVEADLLNHLPALEPQHDGKV